MRRRTILHGLSVGVGGLLLGKYVAASPGSNVDVDISNIYTLPDPAVLRFQWGDEYVWVIRRSVKGLSTLETNISNLNDPLSKDSEQSASCENAYRSIYPNILVVVGKCTNDQCIPSYWWPEYTKVEFGENWNGGFHCECCGSLYDLSISGWRNRDSSR
jgi:ubiquinol-cytochrome c reductase iron-sulfur subunit